MPLFKRTSGGEFWIPADRIVEMSAAPGLLSTHLLLIVPADPAAGRPPGMALLEVEGTLASNVAKIDPPPPVAPPFLREDG